MKRSRADHAKDVAGWMVVTASKSKYGILEQHMVVRYLQKNYPDLVSTSKTGGWAIDPAVLAAFRKLTEGVLVWSRSELRWRARGKGEDPKKRMVP